MPRPITDIFHDGIWKGRRAFIVGGGPSLKGFDWDLLSGELVIAVNRAYEQLPHAPMMFSMDNRFYEWEKDKPAFKNYGGFKVWLDQDDWQYGDDVLTVGSMGKVRGERGWSDSLDDGLGHGASSGYAAANLAHVLGADPIYLLGFDLQDGPPTNWHDGYPVDYNVADYGRMRVNFLNLWSRGLFQPGHIREIPEYCTMDIFPKCTGFPPPINRPIYTSFATPEYFVELDDLEVSLKRFGLLSILHKEPHLGSWEANCQHKADHLLRIIECNPGDDVVWIDADARMQRYPELFDDFKYHIGVHHLKGIELLSGTIYLKNSDKVKHILREWIDVNKEFPNEWDQKNLMAALLRSRECWGPGVLYNLPPEYCCIFDTMREDDPGIDPVIEHFQASRRLKQVVNQT